jgi:cell division protein FtsW
VTFELSMLRTATLCLIAFGAIMVYSASSGTTLLSDGGDSSYYLKRYLGSALVGLMVMAFAARVPLASVRKATPVLLVAAFAGLLLVLVPGFGLEANGARRWLGAGPLQVQPSEIAKLALVLYAAAVIAADPGRTRSLYGVRQLLVVGALMSGLVLIEPDLGTALVIALVLGALLMVGGIQPRHILFLAGALVALALLAILFEPYRRERLLTFLNPWADSEGSGFQSVQAMIAIGSGGPFGVGLGESVQKLFYLPEAHTDMILAVIGEEVGFAGIFGVLCLYGMIAYAGLRTARMAKDIYSKLLAAGVTSVILVQATTNFFAVLGVLPLTGVPLPFISYGNSNLVVLLCGMGLLMNVAQQGARRRQPASGRSSAARTRRKKRHLRLLEGGLKKTGFRLGAKSGSSVSRKGARSGKRKQAVIRKLDAEDRDRSRRDSRARGSGAGSRRRAAR